MLLFTLYYYFARNMFTCRAVNRTWNFHNILRNLSYNQSQIHLRSVLVPHRVVLKFQFNATQLRMAGHNKWSKIARKKLAADIVRSTMISKFVQRIRAHVASKSVPIGTKIS